MHEEMTHGLIFLIGTIFFCNFFLVGVKLQPYF